MKPRPWIKAAAIGAAAASAVLLSIPAYLGLEYLDVALISAASAGFPFFILSYVVRKSRGGFPIQGWKWFFYSIGWWIGMYTVVFWALLYARHVFSREEHFLNPSLHKRIYRFGIFSFLGIILGVAVWIAILQGVESVFGIDLSFLYNTTLVQNASQPVAPSP